MIGEKCNRYVGENNDERILDEIIGHTGVQFPMPMTTHKVRHPNVIRNCTARAK
jgi:hypothetical protein